jgi:hypothetical protein
LATAYDEELVLHPYICEGCTEAVPLTDFQYRERMRVYKRLECEECQELRLTRDREKKGRARREQHGREGDL